jgi:H+/Cl- antiporter ClcA
MKQWLPYVSFDFILLTKVIVGGIAFGLTAFFFSELSHLIKNFTVQYFPNKWLIPVLGGIAIIAISYAIGTFDYLGLGVVNPRNGISIVSAFTEGGATSWSWFWKLLLTAITLGTGFKGGEVTPLFFIGATLGNTLASITGAPVDLFAGLGFIAVFAGATNTPLACTLMGVELFGSNNVVYYAVACFTAYYFSGHTGIYGSQRLAVSKFHLTYSKERPLKGIKAGKRHTESK